MSENSKQKVKTTNVITVTENIKRAKKAFESGGRLNEMDLTDIAEVLTTIGNIPDNKQRAYAFSKVNGLLDSFTDYIMSHSYITESKEVLYTKEAIKGKTMRQFERDIYDSRRKVNQVVSSACTYKDEDGNEYNEAEQKPDSDRTLEDKSIISLLITEAVDTLTKDERQIAELRRDGYTLEECAEKTGLTMKQVRGRIDKCKEKLSEVYKEVYKKVS